MNLGLDILPPASAPYVHPPPIPEQKRLRRLDPSIVPPAPYLIVSHALDRACFSVPETWQFSCPPAKAGGWRSALPQEWTAFPDGPLSHSYEGYFVEGELEGDLKTLGEHMAEWKSGGCGLAGGKADCLGTTVDTFNRYYDFAFGTDSTVLADLSHPSALVVVFFLVLLLRLVQRLTIPRFKALGRCLGHHLHGEGWVWDNTSRISKFGEYGYRLCCHLMLSIYGIWYFYSNPWWSQGGTSSFWDGYPNHSIEPGMVWYYLALAAFNVEVLVNLVEISFTIKWVHPLRKPSTPNFMEPKKSVVGGCHQQQDVLNATAVSCGRSVLRTPLGLEVVWSDDVPRDFRSMMVHHVVTNALIFLSSAGRFTRIGSTVALVHYLSDVVIDLFKLANFLKCKLTTLLFLALALIMWTATRLFVYPCIIVRSWWLESREYLVERGTFDPAQYEAYYPLANVLAWGLILLNVTWFLLLVRIGCKLVGEARGVACQPFSFSDRPGGGNHIKRD
ncbi:hypothetical protein ACHAWF_004519 [Thalassiosira exigua]